MNINFNKITPLNLFPNIQSVKKYSNLAPLQQDTVSFSGSRKLIGASMKNAPTGKLCYDVSTNAEPAEIYLKSVLDKYIAPYSDQNSSNNNAILSYTTRIKSATSIREKVTSKYSKMQSDEVDKFSKELSKLLASYYTLPENVSQENLVSEIKEIISYFPKNANVIPLNASGDFLEDIVLGLHAFSLINREQYSEEEEEQIFSKITKQLFEMQPPKEPNDERYINPETVGGIKHYANDIVGARIVMKEKDNEFVGIALDAITKAVKDGLLKITSIESYVPDIAKLPNGKKLSDYQYGSTAKLRELSKAANVECKQLASRSGYMALHIDVDLSNDIFKGANRKYNGYSGEIQIMGEDVEKLKDVEDLCYKMKDDKSVVHVAYKPFKDHFNKYYTPETAQAFDDYTYALYLYQRAIPSGTTNSSTLFPSIKELGFEGKVPAELDFNILRKLKNSCDINYKNMQEEDETRYANSNNKDLFSSIKRNTEIETLKKFIPYVINR